MRQEAIELVLIASDLLKRTDALPLQSVRILAAEIRRLALLKDKCSCAKKGYIFVCADGTQIRSCCGRSV